MYETKQVLLVRKDLNMTRGKEIAQGAHASLAVVLENQKDARVQKWLDGSFAKIALVVADEKELFWYEAMARKEGLLHRLIWDNGATMFKGVSTATVLAIGPDESTIIDKLTGSLKLR